MDHSSTREATECFGQRIGNGLMFYMLVGVFALLIFVLIIQYDSRNASFGNQYRTGFGAKTNSQNHRNIHSGAVSISQLRPHQAYFKITVRFFSNARANEPV